MAFQMVPLVESDMDDWVRLHYAAFEPIYRGIMFYQKPSDESFKLMASERWKSFQPSSMHAFKVVKSDTGEMVAAATWQLVVGSESDEAQTEKKTEHSEHPDFELYVPEQNADCWRALTAHLNGIRAQAVGTTPRLVLEVLIVEPKYQGKGMGSILMQWGAAEADRRGIICYTEASNAGVKLYEKFGYSRVRSIGFDTSAWGGNGFDIDTVMVREPRVI